jgi:hypothetical protein
VSIIPMPTCRIASARMTARVAQITPYSTRTC